LILQDIGKIPKDLKDLKDNLSNTEDKNNENILIGPWKSSIKVIIDFWPKYYFLPKLKKSFLVNNSASSNPNLINFFIL
jgi:hypothetical protein